MPIYIIVILSLILIILIVAISFFSSLKRTIEGYSSQLFGTKDFISALKKQKQEIAETPKTPYGIDNLILPDITKDFPNMNINEMKKIAEESILTYFNSLEKKQVLSFNNPSEKLKLAIKNKIEDLKNETIKYENITPHKTVINKYDRGESICSLVFQTAIGYKQIANKQIQKFEERINTEFIYIYNDKKINTTESISLHCPNCGAPIEGLGHKICPYCKAGLIDLAPKTWKLNDINMVK